VNAAKGNFDGPRQDYQIDANDQLVTSDDYRKVVVAYRNGAPVMLTDVAKVVNGIENNNQAAWMNQTPAVILNVQSQPGANTISVVKSIKQLMPQLEANLPTGIQVTTLTDLTTAIEASVSDVEFELLLTVGLGRAGHLPLLAQCLRNHHPQRGGAGVIDRHFRGHVRSRLQPGQLLADGAHHFHWLCGGRCHRDDRKHRALYRRWRDHRWKRLFKGAEQIGFTILSLTVSLIAVLIPLLFMGDVVGRLFREFAVTLAVTIVVSAVVSLTLTPMMSARILRHQPKEEQGRIYQATERASRDDRFLWPHAEVCSAIPDRLRC
jgi:multidrug efflux pump